MGATQVPKSSNAFSLSFLLSFDLALVSLYLDAIKSIEVIKAIKFLLFLGYSDLHRPPPLLAAPLPRPAFDGGRRNLGEESRSHLRTSLQN